MNFMKEFILNIEAYIRSGGIVMIPILIVSLVMWILIINRIIVMRRLFIKNMSKKEAGNFVKKNIMPAEKYKGINYLVVRKFLIKRTCDKELDSYILDETVMALVASMNKYLSVIGVLAGIAPLLGLLGTVIGMMVTFNVITLFGTGNAKAMAGGISLALVTTQTGLLVSIPGLYMSGFLNKRADSLKDRIAAAGIYLKRFL